MAGQALLGNNRMLFSSLEFIFRFLILFLFIYYTVPAAYKNAVLLLGSLIFYGLGEPVYVFLMLFSIAVNYFAALEIEKCAGRSQRAKGLLLLTAVYNLGLLLVFKYTGFFMECIALAGKIKMPAFELALPLGISFYTFQILSYVTDVYRGDIRAEKSFIRLGAYLCMFPQLIAGPIVVYRDVCPQLSNPGGRVRFMKVEEGMRLFTIGLASKVLLANRFGQVWDNIQGIGAEDISTPAAWVGAIAYTFQIYFDFNGYSLMAIGLGKLLGFDFAENFHQPYIAGSVTDFWKRWHMTLTSFFRNYVYIPLGGNRGGMVKTLRNMLIVWLLTGFWHGASFNFILWGLYYFIFLAAERLVALALKRKGEEGDKNPLLKVLGHIYTILVFTVGWVIFAITNLSELGAYLGRMFPFIKGESLTGYGFENFGAFMAVWFIVGAVFSTPLVKNYYEKHKASLPAALILLILFWASVSQLVDAAYNPFLYFRF